MGVPAFFRWLSRKYPSVIVECVEEKHVDDQGKITPANSSLPNPNGVEFDNLYLDMNGIIHPCTHPENKPAPKNEDEMMVAIFECIDRLFGIVRPRKLLYMAIDGVAPRAKMNQQRSRRFRASKETTEKMMEMKRIKDELRSRGAALPPEKPKEEHFDSNCITPGTPFMDRLSKCLHYYIHSRFQSDPGWKGIKVILSDANSPGEGEHKIMDFIRKQRAQPDHDPNTSHVLCGADADLIMLGLATHEPNFTIIREEFKPNQARPCDICGQIGHEMKDCTGLEVQDISSDQPKFSAEPQFIFVRLNILREYLQKELEMPNLPFKYDFERAIDDWVFMCFFVGNDFLPHLPSLEIRENAIDRLVNLYKKCVYKTGGFITDSGDVNLSRVQMILHDLGLAEDEIFKKRQQTELNFKARDKARKQRERNQFNHNRPNFNLLNNTPMQPMAVGKDSGHTVHNARKVAYDMRVAGMLSQNKSSTTNAPLESMIHLDGKQPQQSKDKEDDDESEPNDEVRLWEDGFKDRYYESKFDVGPDDLEFRNNVALQYVRGLCWVLRYYYQGCASWKWYFPYHYAPFASDFINIDGLSTEFETGTKPFKPLEQLMSVFPAASSIHVPEPWAILMSDPYSPIIDFYPVDFKIDLNGKKFAWQGVALLPFVDEERLFEALKPYYSKLSQAEIKRNVRGDDRLYINKDNSDYGFIRGLYHNKLDSDSEYNIVMQGMSGKVLLAEDCVSEGGILPSPVQGLKPLTDNTLYVVRYRDPTYEEGYIFPARRLEGAIDPPRVLKPSDLSAAESRNWRPQIGMAPSQTRAYLGQAGHRMINHHAPRDQPNYSNPHAGGNRGYINNHSGNNYNQSGRGHYNSYAGSSSGSHHQNYGNQYNSGYTNPRNYGYNQDRGNNYQNNRRPNKRPSDSDRDYKQNDGTRYPYNKMRRTQ
ncbi:5'-3' exoribonuclease 2 homolog [Ctenocephalides felis]|uniref:5'-3' exoribonuclease 2 homolog n=1 Tax=Ctenocephalides felis TaxID=7515 RepID=UPI000E6E3146|nr:5'-3' exoribonuclease 2 homolog [Ctenocephalides felis]